MFISASWGNPSTTAAPIIGAASVLPSWHKTIEGIYSLFQLQSNWDGEGSSPPDPANIYTALYWAKAFSANFLPPTQVVPGGAGELQLVWLLKDGVRMEADFAEPGKVEMMTTFPDGRANHSTYRIPARPVSAVTFYESAPYTPSPANAAAYSSQLEAA